MSKLSFRLRLAAVLFAVTLAVCSDDDTTPPSNPSIDIELGSTIMSVMQGQVDSLPVNVACHHYAGSVTLSVTGAPSGITATIDPKLLPSGLTRSTLRITADRAVTPGTYSLTVMANASGVATESVVLSLTIAAAPPPTIGVQLGVSALSVGQGQSNSTSISVLRVNYDGPVALAVTGAPQGVTATIEPLVVTNGAWSSVLEVHAAANKAPATHALTVTATGVGVATQTTQLLLTVTAPLAPSLNVILDLDGFLCAWTTLGGSWPWSIIVQRLGGYTGPVNLTIEGLPPSVTASFNVSDDAGGGMSGIVTFTAESNARVGSSYATIRARGVGGADATTQFLFCVAPTS